MTKEKWAYAEEIESQGKPPIDPKEINAESFNLPVLTVDIEESEEVEEKSVSQLADTFLNNNPDLKQKIHSENLDIVAHEVKKLNGKRKWVLIIGFGFAALGLGIAGYKLIRKYKAEKPPK